MKKKLCCIMVAVLLILSVASVGFAAPSVITTSPELPAGYELQIVGEYGEGDAQYDVFAEELEKSGKDNERVYKVFELAVYDMSSGQYVDMGSGDAYSFTLPNGSGYSTCYVLHQSAGSGGIENVGTPENITTDTGFGLFAIIEVSEMPFLEEIPCTGLPSGEQLYKYASYGEGTPQWEIFAEYMSKNGISGTLDHVWELMVWDSHLMEWVPNSEFGEDMSCTITLGGGYTVLHNSSMSGGIENLGSSDSFTTTTGFGTFAFIKPAEEPSAAPTDDTEKSPKTTDNTSNPFGWIIAAAVLTAALTVVVRKTRKAEK